jgi:hypothetical protein
MHLDLGTHSAAVLSNFIQEVCEGGSIGLLYEVHIRIENVSFLDQENVTVLVKSYLKEYTVYSAGRLVLAKLYLMIVIGDQIPLICFNLNRTN